jgi:hypothetical protein
VTNDGNYINSRYALEIVVADCKVLHWNFAERLNKPTNILVKIAESSNESVHNLNHPYWILLWLVYCWILSSSIGKQNPVQRFVNRAS